LSVPLCLMEEYTLVTLPWYEIRGHFQEAQARAKVEVDSCEIGCYNRQESFTLGGKTWKEWQ
jgi:hypothetical protein